MPMALAMATAMAMGMAKPNLDGCPGFEVLGYTVYLPFGVVVAEFTPPIPWGAMGWGWEKHG